LKDILLEDSPKDFLPQRGKPRRYEPAHRFFPGPKLWLSSLLAGGSKLGLITAMSNKEVMKKFTFYTLIIVLAILSVFAGRRYDKAPLSGRKPAGKITIYTSMYKDVIRSLDTVLKKQFPDCKIQFFYGETSQIQAKIAAEQKAGKLGCDILLTAEPSYSLELKEKGLLHSHISAEAGNLVFDCDKEGYWYPVRVSVMVLAYNPEKNARNSVPNSFFNFANISSFRNSLSMGNPLVSGTYMAVASALKDKYGYGYFKALGKQNVRIESYSTALAKLETGEYKAIMVPEESILRKQHEESSKLEIIYPADGAIIIPSAIMIIADKWSANNNTRSAEIITDWFLGPKGQETIVTGLMHSVRKDIPPPYGSVSAGLIQSLPLNWESIFSQREDLKVMFDEAVNLWKR